MGIQVKLPEAREMIEQCLKAGLVPYLEGSPGCGKSAIVHQIAEEYNLKLLDERLADCDPTDLKGYPDIQEHTRRVLVGDSSDGPMYETCVTKKAGYVPMDTYPVEGDPLPTEVRIDANGKEYVHTFAGWLLFFDELPLAPESVQKACYKILLDHKVGQFRLHPKVAKVAAGNLVSDNAMVEELTTAIQSRLIHMEMKVDPKAWLDWARANGIDHRITTYIEWKPDLLFKFNPDHDDKTFACPRTWEFASKLIKPKFMLEPLDKILLAGTVSEGISREFYGFCQVADQLPTIEQICAKPDSIPVPEEPSISWMMGGMLGEKANDRTIEPIMTFVNRIPREFQIITLKEITKRTPKLLQNPAVDKWVAVNGHTLF